MVLPQKIENYCTSEQIFDCENLKEWQTSAKIILGFVNSRHVAEIVFDFFKDCMRMAALPHGAFAACKLRETISDREKMIHRMKALGEKVETKNTNHNKKMLEYSPVKYNGKLMNSIWGFYNRYSPHNIKSNECEVELQKYFVQQPSSVAAFATVESSRMAINLGEE